MACTVAGYAEVRTTDSLEPIRKEIFSDGKKPLVLLDVSGVMLVKSDAVLQRGNRAWKDDWFKRNYPDLSVQELFAIARVCEADISIWRLVDTGWRDLIVKAQEEGVKIAVLTKIWMDPQNYGLRLAKLQAFDLPIRDEFPSLTSGKTYEYSQGVIETGGLKGPVLEEVLSKISNRPEKIIFVDDQLVQVESVHKVCEQLGIPCVAFLFSACHKAPPLDEAIADYQLRTLVKEHRWVPADKVPAAKK